VQIVSSETYYYLPGVAWQKQFNADDSFEEFWELWGKVGNKQKAREVYRRTLKVVDKDTLFTAAKKYIDFRIKQFSYHTTHAASWLNPKNRAWEDKLGQSKPKTNEKQKFDSF